MDSTRGQRGSDEDEARRREQAAVLADIFQRPRARLELWRDIWGTGDIVTMPPEQQQAALLCARLALLMPSSDARRVIPA